MRYGNAASEKLSMRHKIARFADADNAPLLQTMLDVSDEIVHGRAKFPGSRYLLTALVEETGELAQEMERVYPYGHPLLTLLTKHQGLLARLQLQRADDAKIRAEARQVAAVAIRIMEERDPIYEQLTDAEALA
jgi:NTP pyrophosphatase (non-canonical NTP hydrolase)